ncbi:MAG: AAA family ATPase [Oscillospiraceae bacterium]|nr:AAA family ATPase [Oscillospiraceae bacterium]
MIIRSLHLEHYRCFENFDIDFDNQLTVLIGVNGAGKTATLDALSVFLRQAGHPENRYQPFDHLSSADITIGRKPEELAFCLEVQAKSNTRAGTAHIDLAYNTVTKYDGIRLMLREGIESYHQVIDNNRVLCVAYMAGRFIRDEDSILQHNVYNPSTYSAFENNFNRTIDYASTIAWFDNADSDEARDMRDSGHKNEKPELKAVREALSKALLGQYERPRMLGNPPELVIYKKNTNIAYKVSQLSDGYRAMLALVMDLARRMAQVNRDEKLSMKSLLHTPAIVLIDEVELHLHPSWQQTVLNTLLDIFPNTQFIVTTHSPQVLTAIPSKHIRVLSEGKSYAVDGQTQGAEASRILEQVFEVDSRPDGLEIVRILRDYSKLVYDEKWDTPKAEGLRKRLDEHYGNDDPALLELDLHIENSKWERGL